MTLSELIDQLTALQEAHEGQDPEVRIAYQPSWPLRAKIANVRALTGDDAPDEEELEYARELVAAGDEEADGFAAAQAMLEDHPHDPSFEGTVVVWLAASDAAPWNESPYAPRSAWDEE